MDRRMEVKKEKEVRKGNRRWAEDKKKGRQGEGREEDRQIERKARGGSSRMAMQQGSRNEAGCCDSLFATTTPRAFLPSQVHSACRVACG